MKYCAVILSYGLVPYLPEVIKALKGIDTFVLNPNKSWWSDEMIDRTKELAGDTKIINADLANETEARNYAKQWARNNGYDVMIMPDSDEVIEDVQGLIKWIEGRDYDAYCIEIVDYWPDREHPLPKRGHCPIIAIKVKNDYKFYDKRCFNGQWDSYNKLIIHHYGLLIADEKRFKIESPLYDDSYPPREFKYIMERDPDLLPRPYKG